MKKRGFDIRGVFISDIHMPDNINLAPVMEFISDFQPSIIILGGDIIDAKGLHASESMKAEDVKMSWFDRDIDLFQNLIDNLRLVAPKATRIYLEGNHEQRYARLQAKYPDVFKHSLDYRTFALSGVNKYIPYATKESYYKVGDLVFTHGDVYPDLHSKPYALRYSPYKVVYGHLHHLQAYTTHRALLNESPRYALTSGCLSTLNPEWKKGTANQWINGFVSFVSDGRTTIPTPHIIEKGGFAVGQKLYGL